MDACVSLCTMSAVFVLDTGFHVFVWVGRDASPHEKGGGLIIAHVSHPTAVHCMVSFP